VPNLSAVFDKLKEIIKDIEFSLKMYASRSYEELTAAYAVVTPHPGLCPTSSFYRDAEEGRFFCKCNAVCSYTERPAVFVNTSSQSLYIYIHIHIHIIFTLREREKLRHAARKVILVKASSDFHLT
jgi:hypothetical protein